jgi:hypothetical protein
VFRKINDFFRSIKYGIENLINWFPVIWKDRDWDHWFLYMILKKKLSDMEEYHRKYGHTVNAEKTADEMKTCVNLLDRLMKDEYHEMVFKKHDEKWGEPEFNWDECEREGCCELKIFRTNIKDEKDKEQETKEFRRLCEHEANLRKQDIDYLFETMKKYIQSWWD